MSDTMNIVMPRSTWEAFKKVIGRVKGMALTHRHCPMCVYQDDIGHAEGCEWEIVQQAIKDIEGER